MKNIHVVAHTHWDREWYFTVDDSNVLLTENLKKVINTLEFDETFTSYTFDAQTSLIEEFLRINPEYKERLGKLIENKRIFFGPWYTQADSFSTNKESLIRNILYGTKVAESFGNFLKVAYIPDTFGQNAYIPSIFSDFGINYGIVRRGIYTDQLKDSLNFKWKSPDGKSMLTNSLFKGYSLGEFLSSDKDYLKKDFFPMINELEKLEQVNKNILFPTGGDQNFLNEEIPKIVKEINEGQNNYNLVISDFETFMKDSEEFGATSEILGELRGCKDSRVHRTIGSMRYDIKKLNTELECKILNVIEPLGVIGEKIGIEYPNRWLDIMWKTMFDSHAHDSLGGCNSDETNKEVENRLLKMDRVANGLINIMKKKITTSIVKKIGKESIAVAYNLNLKDYKEMFELTLFTREKDFKLFEINGENVEFQKIEQRYNDGGKKIVLTENGDVEVSLPGYYKTIVLVNSQVPATGWKSYEVIECLENEVSGEVSSVNTSASKYETIVISNNKISIEISKNKIDFKIGNRKIEDAFYFEECADYGDSYDFSPLKNDGPILIKNFEVLNIIKGEFSSKAILEYCEIIPKNLQERIEGIKSTKFNILVELEIRKEEDFVRVKQKIENTVKDHRVRAIIKTDFFETKSFSDNGFSLISHENVDERMLNWKEEGYVEAPVPIYNMESLAVLKNNKGVIGVITKGMKEYEVISSNEGTNSLAVTLFRGVGLLGRDNLLWRPNRASGINNTTVYTPEGQLYEKKLEFDYAIIISEKKYDEEIFSMSEKFIRTPVTYQNQILDTLEEPLDRFNLSKLENTVDEKYTSIKITNDSLFTTTLKKSYNNDYIVLRVFNPSEKDQKFNLEGPTKYRIYNSNLSEDKLDEISCIKVPKKGYATVLLK